MTTFFVAPVNRALVIVGALAVWAGSIALVAVYVTKVHEARRAEQAICAARLDAVRARNVTVSRYLAPADPCLALKILAEGT
jgi:hypothetical protein